MTHIASKNTPASTFSAGVFIFEIVNLVTGNIDRYIVMNKIVDKKNCMFTLSFFY